jgi:ABC-type transport system substrate-binding protein
MPGCRRCARPAPRLHAVVRALGLAVALIVFVAPAGAADPAKVLRVAFLSAETGFDPQASGDLYSNHVNRAIFDPPYTYDYLARPYRIVPNTAAALPEISADGLEWTIRIKPGIYFADDAAFNGVRRELTAADYVYSWKRVLDPKTRSPSLQTFDGKFAGAEAAVAKARETGGFDYDAPFEGLQAIDRYTIRIKLVAPAYDLLANLTEVPSAAVAREVIAAYGDGSGWAMANPVGTGPYRLKEWRRAQKIVLEANPGFRDVPYPTSSDPADRAIVSRLAGKKLPLAGRVEIEIIEESNPRLQTFEKGGLDYVTVPTDLAANVLDAGNALKPRFVKAGVQLARGIQPTVAYTFFNMDYPVVGGYTREKIALRRAVGMAFNTEEEIRVIRQGQAVVATQPVPPGVTGHDPKFNGHVSFDPAGARALLDKFGYVDRDRDGWRELPDGRPLLLRISSTIGSVERQTDELWQRSLAAVGIRVEFVKQKFPETLKMARSGQVQMWGLANTNATTDGYGFFGLLYGPNAGLSNFARFNLPEYNALYERSRRLPEGPERSAIFRRMSELVTAYAPWMLDVYRYENVLVYPWVLGYKYSGIYQNPWPYLDIDASRKRVAVQ